MAPNEVVDLGILGTLRRGGELVTREALTKHGGFPLHVAAGFRKRVIPQRGGHVTAAKQDKDDACHEQQDEGRDGEVPRELGAKRPPQGPSQQRLPRFSSWIQTATRSWPRHAAVAHLPAISLAA